MSDLHDSPLIDFPAAPTIGQLHTIAAGTTGETTWQWDSVKWISVTSGRDTSPGTTINISTGTTLPLGFSGSVMVDAGAGAVTVLLPPTPAAGHQVLIKDATGHAGANPISVGGNGQLIEEAGSLAITSNYSWVNLLYSGSQWVQS